MLIDSGVATSSFYVSGTLFVTEGITGSLFGTSSWAVTASFALNALGAAAGDKISSGSVTASVDINGDLFRIISASTTVFYISSSTNIGIGTTAPIAKLQVSGTANVVNFRGSGSAATSSIFTVDGAAGRLFSVNDSLSGSLFSVNTIAGLPVMEAFSDNTVRIGQYGQRALYVSQSRVGIGKEAPLNANLDVSGSVLVTGSLTLVNNQNSQAAYIVSNTTSGINSQVDFIAISDTAAGSMQTGKYSTTKTAYKIIASKDSYLYNNVVGGDIAILNDHISGSIKLAAGGASIPHMFISASGIVGVGLPNPTASFHVSGTRPAVFEVDVVNANTALYVSSSGNIGMNITTPVSGTLHVNGGIFALSVTGSLLGTSSFATNTALDYVSFNRQTGSYTLAITDLNRIVEMNSASANILTVPSSSVVNFLTGSQITVIQYGAGQTSITSGSTNVLLRSANNWLKINARYGAVTLTKVGTDEWYVFGNLNA